MAVSSPTSLFPRTRGRISVALAAVAWLVAVFATHGAAAADVHVAVDGDDLSGSGSAAAPFLTLARAATAATAGDVIRVGAGRFEATAPVAIGPGISLIGAGKAATILAYPNSTWAAFEPTRFLIQLVSASSDATPATLSDFTVSGGGATRLSGGIVVHKRDSVTIRNVDFEQISWGALWLPETRKTLMEGCEFRECGWGSSEYSTGAIMPGHVEDLELRNFTIVAKDAGTGYGITAIGFGAPRASWRRVSIHDCEIDLRVPSPWAGGIAPNIAIETNLISPISASEIYGCTLRNNLSFVGTTYPRAGGPTLRVHHNSMPLTPSLAGDPSNYAVECSLDDFEFDHNFIDRGAWLMSGFYEPRRNLSVHHNVFRGSNARYAPGTIMLRDASDAFIFNNVFDWASAGGSPGDAVVSTGTSAKNITIKNNVFWYTGSPAIPLISAGSAGLSATHNVLFNVSEPGFGEVLANQLTAPEFAAKGEPPTPYYLPSGAQSNLVDQGVGAGLPLFRFEGRAPDVGAYEYCDAAPCGVVGAAGGAGTAGTTGGGAGSGGTRAAGAGTGGAAGSAALRPATGSPAESGSCLCSSADVAGGYHGWLLGAVLCSAATALRRRRARST